MKKTNIRLIGALLLAGVAVSSCSDEFLQEKKNYDQTDTDVYNYFTGAQGRVSDIYKWCTHLTLLSMPTGNTQAQDAQTISPSVPRNMPASARSSIRRLHSRPLSLTRSLIGVSP